MHGQFSSLNQCLLSKAEAAELKAVAEKRRTKKMMAPSRRSNDGYDEEADAKEQKIAAEVRSPTARRKHQRTIWRPQIRTGRQWMMKVATRTTRMR
jgi:hypothetical protein